MTWKILRLFINTLIGDHKDSLIKRGDLTQHIQKHLSRKQRDFSELFCAFFKSISNFEHFQKRMTLRAYVFLNIWTPKDVVR